MTPHHSRTGIAHCLTDFFALRFSVAVRWAFFAIRFFVFESAFLQSVSSIICQLPAFTARIRLLVMRFAVQKNHFFYRFLFACYAVCHFSCVVFIIFQIFVYIRNKNLCRTRLAVFFPSVKPQSIWASFLQF